MPPLTRDDAGRTELVALAFCKGLLDLIRPSAFCFVKAKLGGGFGHAFRGGARHLLVAQRLGPGGAQFLYVGRTGAGDDDCFDCLDGGGPARLLGRRCFLRGRPRYFWTRLMDAACDKATAGDQGQQMGNPP